MNKIEKKYLDLVNQINIAYNGLSNLSNDALREKLSCIEQEIANDNDKEKAIDEHLVEVFAIVKETARRFSKGDIVVTANKNDCQMSEKYDFVTIDHNQAIYKNHWDVCGNPMTWNMVHYDEQILTGILLHYGYATEMATGEGKTLVATLPVFLNALTHQGVHLMTVNDYLSKRDFETTRPIYMFHGLSADCIEYYKRYELGRKKAYLSDITFGTNSGFTFDYLFDHLTLIPHECVQQAHHYAIIDELDSILIDEAVTPHIVSDGDGPNYGEIYREYLPIVKELVAQEGLSLYTIDKLNKYAEFTKEGIDWLARKTEITDLFATRRPYEIKNFDNLEEAVKQEIEKKHSIQNVLHQLLLALTVYERDEDYIVGEKIIIIDQNTGRLKESNRWEHGLHTAIEVKEGVKTQEDSNGIAVISLKNYFRLYHKIAGMSGTIISVQKELEDIYGLRSVSIPTHNPNIRVDEPLRIFKTAQDKNKAIVDLIIHNKKASRPTLVSSTSVKKSEEISEKLNELGIAHNKLNAKTEMEESEIVAKAGNNDTITISTSIAGRGTDIKLSQKAKDNGGLMVIGTELFDSSRVDNQLRGRAGRQGDPGSSVFFASLDDFILNNLTEEDSAALRNLADSYPESEISYDNVRSFFVKAQSLREESDKKNRSETTRKDDIIAPQRTKFYKQRNAVLFHRDASESIINEILTEANISKETVEEHLSQLYQKVRELIIRSILNNINRTKIYVPFADNLHTFAIQLDVQSAKSDYDYFCKEFMRQIILQIYDKQWKRFVIYMKEDLDQVEIDKLNEKYNRMMQEIHSIISSRLLHASVPFEIRDNHPRQEKISKKESLNTPLRQIKSDLNPTDKCPCGSGKLFCECHGSNIRRRENLRTRR